MKDKKNICSECGEDVGECESCGTEIDEGTSSYYDNDFWCVANAGHFCLECVLSANKEEEEDD